MIKEIKKVLLSLFAGALICSGVGFGSWVIYSYKGEGSVATPSYSPSINANEPTFNFTFNPNGGTWKTGNSTEIRSPKEKYTINRLTTKTFADIPNGPAGKPYFKGWYYTDIHGKDALFDFENVDYNNLKYSSKPTIELKAMYSADRFFDAVNTTADSPNSAPKVYLNSGADMGGTIRADLGVVKDTIAMYYHSDTTKYTYKDETTGSVAMAGAASTGTHFKNVLIDKTFTSYTVKLTNDVVIESGGALKIGGVFSQCGFIKNQHACLDLNGHNILVKQGGEITCFGLITNSKSTGEIIFDGGKLQTNFVINDFKGGGNTCTFYFNGIVPFYDFILPYVDCTMKFIHHGHLIGRVLIEAAKQTKEAFINVIGTNSDYLIEYLPLNGTDNSNNYITVIPSKFNQSTPNYGNCNNSLITDFNSQYKQKIDFYNSRIVFNSLSMTLGVTPTRSVTVDCSYVTFPVPKHYNVNFHNSEFDLYQRVALMPGAKVYFDSKSKLNLLDSTKKRDGSLFCGGSVAVLDTLNNYTGGSKISGTNILDMTKNVKPAELKIDGHINVEGGLTKYIGGNIIMSNLVRHEFSTFLDNNKIIPHSNLGIYCYTGLGGSYGPMLTNVFNLPVYSNEPGNTYCYFDMSGYNFSDTNSNSSDFRYDDLNGLIYNKNKSDARYLYECTNKKSSTFCIDAPGTLDKLTAMIPFMKYPLYSTIESLRTDLEGTFKEGTKGSFLGRNDVSVVFDNREYIYLSGVHIPVKNDSSNTTHYILNEPPYTPFNTNTGFDINTNPTFVTDLGDTASTTVKNLVEINFSKPEDSKIHSVKYTFNLPTKDMIPGGKFANEFDYKVTIGLHAMDVWAAKQWGALEYDYMTDGVICNGAQLIIGDVIFPSLLFTSKSGDDVVYNLEISGKNLKEFLNNKGNPKTIGCTAILDLEPIIVDDGNGNLSVPLANFGQANKVIERINGNAFKTTGTVFNPSGKKHTIKQSTVYCQNISKKTSSIFKASDTDVYPEKNGIWRFDYFTFDGKHWKATYKEA